jgi:hypothetical protein
MTQWFTASTAGRLFLFLSTALSPFASGQAWAAQNPSSAAEPIQTKEHYVMRDGLRIYLWEKHKQSQDGTFARSGKVALLVHGGTRYSQLATHDKRYVVLPNAGHMLMLEKDHGRFQHEVLSFFDRPY